MKGSGSDNGPRLVSIDHSRFRAGAARALRWARARPGMTVAELMQLTVGQSSRQEIEYLVANGTLIMDPPLPVREVLQRAARPHRPRPPSPPPERHLVPYAGKRDGQSYGNLPPLEPPPTTPRQCLRCRATFPSEGAHNRLCDPCRQAISRLGQDLGPDDGSHDPFAED